MRELISGVRRKVILLALCLFLPGLSAFFYEAKFGNSSDSSRKPLNIAGLEILKPTIDLGTVWASGQGIQREFVITNNTGHPIKIGSVESDCGCTVPRVDLGEVPNGQSMKITVDFWPPASGTTEGSFFRRTISAIVYLGKETAKVPLILTGFLAPDASLRVSPQSVEIDETLAGPTPASILHFKGSAQLLANIPDRLFVAPGSHQRILIPDGRVDHAGTIGTKDVNLFAVATPGNQPSGGWQASITFAPDTSSEGLMLHVNARMPQSIVASPPSLVLTDRDVPSQAIIQLSTQIESEAITFNTETTLPVECEISRMPGNNHLYSLHVQVHGHIRADVSGIIQLTPKVTTFNQVIRSISIPVVILHSEQPAQKPTAAL